MDFKQGKSNFM